MLNNTMQNRINNEDWQFYFHNTCGSCPEQYDIYFSENDYHNKEKSIGYIKLRGGYLYCQIIFSDDIVFDYTFEGDNYKGCFDSDEERNHFLELIKKSIVNYLTNNQNE